MRINFIGEGGLSKAGGTLTGPLILAGNPTQPLEATTKQYVDNTRVNKAGDTMTGPLTLSGNPVNNLHAATKQYVDSELNTVKVSEFIASGNIPSAGLTVGINTNGTVSVISNTGTTDSYGSSVEFNNSIINWTSATYNSTNNKVIIAYRNNSNSGYGTAIVGTVSGTSISFGAPVVFNANNTEYISTTYDSTSNKVIIAYRDNGNSNYGTVIIGTVSGTSISFGTPVVFNNGNTAWTSIIYVPTLNKVIIAYYDGPNSGSGTAVVGTISGTSISFGTPVVFNSGPTYYISTTYNSTNNKVIIAYSDVSNGNVGTVIAGNVNNNSITFGVPTIFNNNYTRFISVVYSSGANRVIIAYQGTSSTRYGAAIVGYVINTRIYFGQPITFNSDDTGWTYATYNPNNNKVVIAYCNESNSYYGAVIVGTVNSFGNFITFSTPVVFSSSHTFWISAIYDSTNDKIVIAYRSNINSGSGRAIVYSPGVIITNKDKFIGISQQSATNGQVVKVKIKGSVDSNQSGLTPGKLYYVSDDGTLTTTKGDVLAGRALSATKLLIM